MQLLQSAWSEFKEAIIQKYFRKAGVSEIAAKEAHGDLFIAFTAEEDMELD